MKLTWSSNGIAHSADGSNGFQFVIFTGWKTTLVKRVPAPSHRKVKHHGKSVVHAQQEVATVAAAKELAQQWEDATN